MDDFLTQLQCEDLEPSIEEYCGIYTTFYPDDSDYDITHVNT